MSSFKKAVKQDARLRLGLTGPAGSGKTMTALALATRVARGGKVAVIDTERGSASKYADLFNFDVLELTTFAPEEYVRALRAAEAEGYSVIVIDSLSHEWAGKNGALEQVDKVGQRGGNKYTAWGTVTPKHNEMVDAILMSSCHVIATMRTKTEYVLEMNDKGKQVPRKIGLAPVQRDGLEYEFDVVGELDLDNRLTINKTRCAAIVGKTFGKPSSPWDEHSHELADALIEWLGSNPPPIVRDAAAVEKEARDALLVRAKAAVAAYEAQHGTKAKDEWRAKHLGTTNPATATSAQLSPIVEAMEKDLQPQQVASATTEGA